MVLCSNKSACLDLGKIFLIMPQEKKKILTVEGRLRSPGVAV